MRTLFFVAAGIALLCIAPIASGQEDNTNVQVLKTQFDDLLAKFKAQQEKVKEASKAYVNAVAPKLKTKAEREKIGWRYQGSTTVHPMSEYKDVKKKKKYAKLEIVYKEDGTEAEIKETKEKFDAEKKVLADLEAQLKQVKLLLQQEQKK